MESPLVSVIIPAYNRAAIIGETIENVLQQTYSNIELIVVDDGSTDDTQTVLRSYGSRIRWVAQRNAGPSAARNHGIAIAKGEIIAFQDSDDAWHPTKIERQVSLLRKAGESVPCCLCNSTLHLPEGRVVRSFENAPVNPPIEEGIWLNVSEVLSSRFILFNQAVAIRRNVLERVGGFDESFRILEDKELQLRLSLEGPWAFIREPLVTRQQMPSRTLSQEGTQEMLYECEVRILEKILRRVDGERRLACLRPLMIRELKRARRQLRAAHFKGSRFLGASVFGRGLELIEHYRMAAYRRTPWFPKMQVAPLDSQRP
jgi:glycosyltransferase involved in cell wall biosynthesis